MFHAPHQSVNPYNTTRAILRYLTKKSTLSFLFKEYKVTKKDCFLIQISNIFKYKKISLSKIERSILTAIAAYADEDGHSDASREEIGSYTDIDKSNISRYLKKLKNKKIITVKKQFEEGKKCMKSNLYKINISALIELSVDQNGKPFISRTGEVDISFESNNEQEGGVNMTTGGSVTLTLGSRQADRVKIRSLNLKKDQKPKDIVQDQFLNNVEQMQIDVLFEDFWATYPRKEKKKEAQRIWIRDKLERKADMIIDDIRQRQLRHDRWVDRQFVPLPSTYLNNESWNDEIIEAGSLTAKKEKFDAAAWILNGVKKDYEDRTRNQEPIFGVSNYLSKKVD